MGALQKIRSKSTLLVAVIAAGLLAFVIPWGEISQFFNISKDKAFVVNGDVVKTGQYSKRIDQRLDFEKMRTGQQSLDEMTTSQIREEVYLQIIKEKILDEEADKLGITVTDEELNDMVYSKDMSRLSPILFQIPYFADQRTGQFSPLALSQFLTAVNEDTSNMDERARAEHAQIQDLWFFIENWMRYNRLEEKYASLVAGSIGANNLEAKSHFEDSKIVANLAYVSEDYNTIVDSTIQVSDSEIQDLYNKRKENFLSKTPTRQISYFVKDVIPSEADYDVVLTEIEKVREKLQAAEDPSLLVSEYSEAPYVDAYHAVNSLPYDVKNFVQSANVGDIQGPTRNEQSFVMYKYVDKTIAPDSIQIQILPIQSFDPLQASNLADSLFNVVKGGKDFTALTKEMFPNEPSAGQADWVNEAMLSSIGISKQCFAAAKGEVLKLKLNGMNSLVKIADKTKPVAKAKIAIIQMPVIVSDKTQNSIDNELNKFLSENPTGETFESAARNSGYNLVSDALINPSDFGLEQLTGSRQVITWAFNNEIGQIKKFDLADKRIISLVKSEEKEGYVPVSNKEVKHYLRAELVKDKKATQLIEKIKAKNATSLESLAETLDTKVDTAKFVTFQTNNISGLGYEPVMNVYAKLGKENTLTSPTKGNNGVYVVSILNQNADTKEYNEQQVKATLSQNNMYMVANQAVSALMDKMKIEDNRVKLYY